MSSSTKLERSGSCLCGKVQLRILGEPLVKVLCHCISCQKSSGVIFESNLFYHKDVSELSVAIQTPSPQLGAEITLG
jgi:hypothetical protein